MKNEPIWILEKTVLKIHDAQLAEHGGVNGLRDIGLLQSALAHPINLYFYHQTSICELAAAYADKIVNNHPFIDANKRTAYVVMVLFLQLNGYRFLASKEEKVVKLIKLATKEINGAEFAEWLYNNIAK